MAAMGSIRGGAHGRGLGRGGHSGARGGHAPSHGAARGHAPVRGGHQPVAHGAKGGLRSAPRNLLMSIVGISPIDLMAMAMGAGAMGIIGRKVLKQPEFIVAMMAIAGAVVIDLLIVKPLFNALLRFASPPSEGLEGMISHLAQAATTFDAQGRGLVALTLDGQTTQILATLEEGELSAGTKVKKGDQLVVLEVDPKTNKCRVSRDIASDYELPA